MAKTYYEAAKYPDNKLPLKYSALISVTLSSIKQGSFKSKISLCIFESS